MLQIIIPIAMFDLLDDFDWEDTPLDFDIETQEKLEEDIRDQMEDIGY